MDFTNYLTLRSSNLAALKTANLNVSTLTGSTVTITTSITAPTAAYSTLTGSTLTFSTLTGSTLTGSTMVMSSITASFLTLSTLTTSSINGSAPGGGSSAFSTLIVSSLTASSIVTASLQPYCIIGGAAVVTELIYNKTVICDANLMSVTSSAGMTNSGTSGWISSSGRFYPTISGRWLISWAIYYLPNAVSYGILNIVRYDSNNNPLETRQCLRNLTNGSITYFENYSSVFYCNVGEYLSIVKGDPGLYGQVYYDAMRLTHASFAFIM